MLKNRTIVIAIIATVILGLIFVIGIKSEKNDVSEERVEYNVDAFEKITLDQLNEKIDSKAGGIIFISNIISKFDSSLASNLKKVNQKYKKNISVLDIIDLDSESKNYKKYTQVMDDAKEVYNKKYKESYETLINTTPILIYYKDESIKDVLIGNQNYDKIEEWFKKIRKK